MLELATFMLEDQVHWVIAHFGSCYFFKHAFSVDLLLLLTTWFSLLTERKKEWEGGYLLGWNFTQRRTDFLKL